MLVMAKSESLPVAAARAGEPRAWEVLFRRYQLPMYVYVFELVRDEQASLDIVQETFIAAVGHIGGLRSDERFGSWLFGIAHQRCIQRWRQQNREARWREQAAEVPPELELGPDELLIRREQEAEFMRVLEQLPLLQRTALLLHFLEDFSLEEIAGITGASLGTVKSRIHYGKQALRQLLQEASYEKAT
jgi:RNA polymerase sigma-70 factor (ECF subfamily)